MAKLVGVYNASHSPFCYMPPERWGVVRANRKLREDVPTDDDATNAAKSARIQSSFAVLTRKIAEADPDVVVVFGDDQLECFDFTNFPAFAVYVGKQFAGGLADGDRAYGAGPTGTERTASTMATVKGHPDFGTAMLTGLMQHGFDPAFSMDVPKPEHGVGHAFLRPAESLGILDKPIVPVLVNCYYAPQVTAKRCYQIGKALREVIEEYPSNLKVAVIGSGGLWHTPGMAGAYLDEEFDRAVLGYMEAGDAKAMADHFDRYVVPAGDDSQPIRDFGKDGTGMPGVGGPQGGTRETCNWIAAAAVADGSKATLVDYVPVYASPIGCGFAYWDNL